MYPHSVKGTLAIIPRLLDLFKPLPRLIVHQLPENTGILTPADTTIVGHPTRMKSPLPHRRHHLRVKFVATHRNHGSIHSETESTHLINLFLLDNEHHPHGLSLVINRRAHPERCSAFLQQVVEAPGFALFALFALRILLVALSGLLVALDFLPPCSELVDHFLNARNQLVQLFLACPRETSRLLHRGQVQHPLNLPRGNDVLVHDRPSSREGKFPHLSWALRTGIGRVAINRKHARAPGDRTRGHASDYAYFPQKIKALG